MDDHRRRPIEVDLTPIRAERSVALQTPCLIWTGWTNYFGYGVYKTGPLKDQRAHRVAFERSRGRPIGAGMVVLHHCDNPACVEPKHLFEGTRLLNTRDMIDKGRARFCTRKPGRYWSKLTEAQVDAIRSSVGISQETLARQFGVSQSLISAIKTGKVWSSKTISLKR